jgi:uracil-DNA glycosylase family 4
VASEAEPDRNCPICPRLVAYRGVNRAENPDWWNGPAPSFGDPACRMLIVGLAPGRQGANRTGRPFTGDYAGDLLYATLGKLGMARGTYRADPNDGMTLHDVMITNAVRCAPPENKPTPAEIAACRPFLRARLDALPNLRAIVALGAIAHESVLRTLAIAPKSAPFKHGGETSVGSQRKLFTSYHCSRYNTQTYRLTPEMFETVMAQAAAWARLPSEGGRF